MNYEEKTEALVDLLENNEVTEAQVTYLLEWLQGNGYVEAYSEKEAIRIGEETLGMVVRVRNEVKF
jgi:hypothetical protein|tara:strand:- start:651 stop:848 length:198 start_codon:yes stop_codon:yes gene_type:complete